MRCDYSMVMYSEGSHLCNNAKIPTPEYIPEVHEVSVLLIHGIVYSTTLSSLSSRNHLPCSNQLLRRQYAALAVKFKQWQHILPL